MASSMTVWSSEARKMFVTLYIRLIFSASSKYLDTSIQGGRRESVQLSPRRI